MNGEQFERRMHKAAHDLEGPVDLMRDIAQIGEEEAHRQVRGGRNRAYRTGYLDSTIYGRARSAHEAVVGATAGYSKFVHDGTRYMRPRPFIDDGIAAGAGRIERAAEKFGEKVLGEVAG